VRLLAPALVAFQALILTPAGLALDHESADNSTPDCGTAPVEPFPALQRLRHLARLGVDRWHGAGYRGQGLKVAVLDSGFRGYRAHLGKALPARVAARSFRSDGDLEAKDSQHGILCGEVIHALAPDAELLLANWEPGCHEQFLDAARWARRQGARVISCSVIMPSWSDGEGSGPVHEELARILGPGDGATDLLCFASAGNVAQRHWAGPFRDGGRGWHEWEPGRTDNVVTSWGTEPVAVELYWHGEAEYELHVLDRSTGEEVGRSPSGGAEGWGYAVVRLAAHGQERYVVRVRLARGKPSSFHLTVLGGGLACGTSRGSIPFPGDGPEVIAVGAVEGDGRRAAYSSCGPNSSLPKPDLVAAVPFPSLWRPRPFTGTSAAAPQAAALAALLWSRHPRWTANQVREALRTAARDLGPPGHDPETGYGLVTLPPRDTAPNEN
jgi:hypothetical protein